MNNLDDISHHAGVKNRYICDIVSCRTAVFENNFISVFVLESVIGRCTATTE
jgi:hypothetical protein